MIMEVPVVESTLTETLLSVLGDLDLLTRLVQIVKWFYLLTIDLENDFYLNFLVNIAYHGAAAFSEPESAALRVSANVIN